MAKDEGLTEGHIEALHGGAGTDHSPAEAVALDFAERFVTAPEGIDDETFKRLREHFSDPALVELAWAVGSFFLLGRLKLVFELE